MFEKLKTINTYNETEIDIDTDSVCGLVYEDTPLIQKINELVDAVNGILAAQEQYATIYKEDVVPMLTPENEEPDFITTSYMTDGHTQEYYGQNGASIVLDHPLPAGYIITIKESETKDGDNE